MRYDDKYRGVWVGFEPEGEGVFVGKESGPCWECGDETSWVDLVYEAYICSEECNVNAVRKLGRVH